MGKKCACGHWLYGLRIEARVLVWLSARKSKHLLRARKAWSLQKSIVDFHLRAGDVDAVKVCDVETGNTYTAGLATFAQHGERVDFGFGEQVALPLRWWSVNGETPTQTASVSVTQLTLWS